MKIDIKKREIDRLLRRQMALGLKIIKLSDKVRMNMTWEKAQKVSMDIEQVAYDLSRVLRELNNYMFPDHYIPEEEF